MNENKPLRKELTQSYYMLPEEFFDNMLARQDRILEFIDSMNKPGLNGYITEAQAAQLLNKKTTWFWMMRKEGKLPFKKIGRTSYYSAEDIRSLLETDG